MKTREFDPVLSAALRNELEALPGAPRPAPLSEGLRRPQVWVTAVTALVLIVVVIGVLRLTAPAPQPAEPKSRPVDPLTSVTTPSSPSYVARAVDVLLHARGTGTGTRVFEVPPGVRDVRTYVACTPGGSFSASIDGRMDFSSACDRETGGSGGVSVRAGRHRMTVHVGAGVDYAVLVIARPAPTISTGALIDPLTAIRDRHTPDALLGDTRPVLRTAGRGDADSGPLALPQQRLRVFLACTPVSSATRVRIDEHVITGCMNSVAHWFDFTPSKVRTTVVVTADDAVSWSLLVVRAPAGAHDSPANALLPFPPAEGRVLARSRGAGAPGAGTYIGRPGTIHLLGSCRGTGWLEVTTGDSGTTSRGASCSQPWSVSFGGDDDGVGKRQRWAVVPHGDISWTLTISADG